MIIEEIKLKQVNARKNRDSFRAGVLTTLLGEAEKIGKDAGNRKTNDSECIKIVKKFTKNIIETLKLTDKNSKVLNKELDILSEFLPDEMSDNDISAAVAQIILNMRKTSSSKIVIGTVMKEFKNQFENESYSGKTVSDIIRGQI